MTISTSIRNAVKTEGTDSRINWKNIVFSLVAAALFGMGIWLRFHKLDLPFDRDSYDEGVYWQSLRAMSGGHGLYQQIFYSQPPFFLLSAFPIYSLFGQTLESARLGIAGISLAGLVGAFLLGKALAGRVGALAALLLLVVDPLYLAQSQTIQAEAPSAALSLLSVGLIYLWWERPDGMTGIWLAVLSSIALSLGILCKLLAASTLVPVGLLMLARGWQILQQAPGSGLVRARSLIAGIIAFVLIMLIVFLPFAGSWQQLWHSMITFHTDAGNSFKSTQGTNLSTIRHMLFALTSCAALYGTVVALLRRDWRALPLIAWLLVTVLMLWRVVPLFPHHLVALTPPLIALAVLSITPGASIHKKSALSLATIAVGLLFILLTVVLNGQQVLQYYRAQQQASDSATNQQTRVVKDLQATTRSDQLVITDAQFIADLARRNTPPELVDTSTVRIETGYINVQQLIQEAERPEVHSILIYTGRLLNPKVEAFDKWVRQHFRQVQNYGGGKGLWIRV